MKIILYRIIRKLYYYYSKYFLVPKYFPKISKKVLNYKIASIQSTAYELSHSNKSLARFGDGEIKWLLGVKNMNSFEKSSKLLSNRLIEVLKNQNKNFMLCLPDGFTLNKKFVSSSDFFWKQFITKYGNNFFNYLNKDNNYYNTSVSRPYIDYNNREIAKETFKLWKQVWHNKNILIIEGKQTRLGVGDDLFQNVRSIKRIECPSTNAFEFYESILEQSLSFLDNHKFDDYTTLISLGPTATILAYDLFKHNYRSIDVGHIDIEYEWYLMGAKEKIDLPYKYVNETSNGHYALPISSKNYDNEIIKIIS